MKQAAWFGVLAGLSVGLAACSNSSGGGGGGGGGGLYVQSCSLSCSNGVGGTQVSCGLINTFQNQDVALVFNDSVNAGTVNGNTFQVNDTGTGAVPPGSYIVAGNKVSFRPRLTFDAVGNPVFGFVPGGTYQIKLPGTKQGDIPPYIVSGGGKSNESRVLCTITTDQGLIDAVPGNPVVTIWVDVKDPNTGAKTKKRLPNPGEVPNPNDATVVQAADRIATESDIEFVFADLMNLGTVVIPALGQAPLMTIMTDPDGDINTTTDQVALAGSYTFLIGSTSFVNQTTLQTGVRFHPTNGLPSSGQDINNPRRVVIDVPSTVKDLKGNGVANSGKRAFIPQLINFTPVVLPAGGEKFTSTANMDPQRSGAYWGIDVAGGATGQLTPGQGGGSGRMGDLVVAAGATKTLYTSPIYAQGRITMTANPKPIDNGYLQINGGPQLLFKKAPTGGTTTTTELKVQDFIGDTLREAAAFLNNNPGADPEIAKCRYWVENNAQLVCEYKTLGTVGNTFTLTIFPASTPGSTGPIGYVEGGSVPQGQAYSIGNLSGGLDSVEFGDDEPEEELLTNLFNATEGVTVPHYFADDGVFEFSTIDIQAGATLRFIGDNPPRLLARGRCTIEDTAVLDISGINLGVHVSANPVGQAGGAVVDLAAQYGFRLVGGRGGPGGGAGGQGANRADFPFVDCGVANSSLTCLANGGTVNNPIVNHALTEFYSVPAALTLFDGQNGEGAGGVLGYGLAATTGLGIGKGGARWPTSFPSALSTFNGMASNGTCKSEQIAAPGSGGAYATDGSASLPGAVNANSTFPAVGSNTAAPAQGGDSTTLNLEPVGTPGPRRGLSPDNGYLRGGGGGGGGGSHIADTTTANGTNCFGGAAAINLFRDHSAAGGGGAGGAIQIVAGRKAQIDGKVDASGGNGGSVSTTGLTFGLQAVPGGGGAGGGILLQAREVGFGTLPNRLDVVGGLGGAGNFSAAGGNGGTGLVHVEDRLSILPGDVAAKVNPFDQITDPLSQNWVSVATWNDQLLRPDSYSGAESCWMQVTGNFFSLAFNSDVGGTYGWDMELVVDLNLPPPNNGVRRINYRNPAAPGVDPITGIPPATTSAVWGGNTSQAFWGGCIDAGTLPPQCGAGAPIIVRFQGARAAGTIVDPCNVDVNSQFEVQGGSLTPWVMHPEELNNFTPPPDMVRFQIVFDRSHPDFASIKGITNVRINATPD